MRLFQNSGLYPSYLARLNKLAPNTLGFEERRRIFLDDRFGALHFLKPVLERRSGCVLHQRRRRNPAAAMGARKRNSRRAIARGHSARADRASSDRGFLQSRSGALPQRVRSQAAGMRQKNALLAGGAVGTGGFDRLWRGAWKFSFDPGVWRPQRLPSRAVLPGDRPRDGRVSDTASGRSMCFLSAATPDIIPCAQKILERVASLAGHPAGGVLPRRVAADPACGKPARPLAAAAKASASLTRSRKSPSPRFSGGNFTSLIGKSKIVLNGAIDMAGQDRGNMRCFEAMGCGALLLSDAGNYPEGMDEDETMLTYETGEDCLDQIGERLANWSKTKRDS